MKRWFKRILGFAATALFAVACSSEPEIVVEDVQTNVPKEVSGIEYVDMNTTEALAWGPPGVFSVKGGYAVPDNVRGAIVLFDETFNIIREIDVREQAVGISAVAQHGTDLFALDVAAPTPNILRLRGDEDIQVFEITVPSETPPSGLTADEEGIVLEYGGGDVLYRVTDDDDVFSYDPIQGHAWNGVVYTVENSQGERSHERTLRFAGISSRVSVPNHLGSMQVMGSDGEGGIFILVEDVKTDPDVAVEQTIIRIDSGGEVVSTARIPIEERALPVWRGVALSHEHKPVVLIPERRGLQFRTVSLRDPSDFLSTETNALPEEEFGILEQPLLVAGTGCLTPAQMQSNAQEYLNTAVGISAISINNSPTCGGSTRFKPAYLGGPGTYLSVSYNWNGFDSPSQFVSFMGSNKTAGNWNTTDLAYCAKGVDCSGFVSRVWGLTSKIGTSMIPGYSKPYTPLLTLGDVLNKANSHVVVFVSNAANGINVYEATHYLNYDRVVYVYRPWSTLTGYVAYRSNTSCL